MVPFQFCISLWFILFIQLLQPQTIFRSVTLTPANTNIKTNGATIMTHHQEVKSLNDTWNANILTQNRWQFILSLDNSWGFYTDVYSSIKITINAPSATTASTTDWLVIGMASDNTHYISALISTKNMQQNQIYPQCDTSSAPTQAHGIGDIASILNANRSCDVADGSCTNWSDMLPTHPPNINTNPFPITLQLDNNAQTNALYLSFNTNAYPRGFVQQCGFVASPTNRGLKVYIGGDGTGESFKIKSLQLSGFIKSTTKQPSTNPTKTPITTVSPSNTPTTLPSNIPSVTPTRDPSAPPTSVPSDIPSTPPTFLPTVNPSATPSMPSIPPTVFPTIAAPSASPSKVPSYNPTNRPSEFPTNRPSEFPTNAPTYNPTDLPSELPTITPSYSPSFFPTVSPTSMVTHPPTNPPTASVSTNSPSIPPRMGPPDALKPIHVNPILHPTTIYPTSTPTVEPTAATTMEEEESTETLIHVSDHEVPEQTEMIFFTDAVMNASDQTDNLNTIKLIVCGGCLVLAVMIRVGYSFYKRRNKRFNKETDVPKVTHLKFERIHTTPVLESYLIRVHYQDRQFDYTLHQKRDEDEDEYEYDWDQSTFYEFTEALTDAFGLHFVNFRLYQLEENIEQDINEIEDITVAFDCAGTRFIDIYIQVVEDDTPKHHMKTISEDISFVPVRSSTQSTTMLDNNWDEVIATCQRIIRTTGESREKYKAYKRLGFVEERRGNMQKAMKYYRRALNEEEDDILEERVMELLDLPGVILPQVQNAADYDPSNTFTNTILGIGQTPTMTSNLRKISDTSDLRRMSSTFSIYN